ncbi:MAG: TonB-dependent receptor [Acidobacteriota bacterium]
MKKFLITIVSIFLLSFAFVPADETTGKLTVTVTDEANAALPGATVSVTSSKLPTGRAIITDADGVARFILLPPDDYDIKVQIPGYFVIEKQKVGVRLGGNTTITVVLPKGVQEQVTVYGDRPLIDVKDATIAENVDYSFMDNLPNARTFQEVMNLLPGVVAGNNPNVKGQSAYDNLYLIDGTDTTDPRTQTWGSMINFDLIDQWEVQTGAFKAEYGRATGAVANLITKSGTNEFEGTLRVEMQDTDWNSNGDPGKPAGVRSTETRPALTFGGPIWKDRLWFYLGYEKRDRYQDYQRLDWLGNATESKSNYNGRYLFGKLTWQINETNRIDWSYQEDPIDIPNAFSRYYYSYVSPQADQTQIQGGYFWNLRWHSIFSKKFSLEAFYSRYRGNIDFVPQTTTRSDGSPMPTFVHNGLYYYGGNFETYMSDRNRDDLRVALNYIEDTNLGTHNFKFGVESVQLENKVLDNYYGIGTGVSYFTYGAAPLDVDAPDFELGDMALVLTNQPGQLVTKPKYYAFYIQDDWELAPNITLNLGLRFDQQKLENNLGDTVVDFGFADQIAPRIGFSWDLKGNKIHASASRYYDLISDYVAADLNVVDPVTHTWYYYVGYPDYWYPIYYYTTGANHTVSPDLKPTYTDEFTAGYDWKITDNQVLRTNLIWAYQKRGIEDLDNVEFDVDGDGVADNLINDGNYHIDNVPGKMREYKAIMLSYMKTKGTSNWDIAANYTYSKTEGWISNSQLDSYGDTSLSVHNRYGKMPYDLTHQLKLAGSLYLPWDIRVGGIFQYQSGVPWTPVIYVRNLGPAGLRGSVYYNEPRGSRELPRNFTLDLELSKIFKLGAKTEVEFYLDILNVLDKQKPISVYSRYNATSYNAYGGNPTEITYTGSVHSSFGRYTVYQTPRQLRLGMLLKF